MAYPAVSAASRCESISMVGSQQLLRYRSSPIDPTLIPRRSAFQHQRCRGHGHNRGLRSYTLRVDAKKHGSESKENKKSKASPPPVIVIDNYDSFTYNICQYLGDLGCQFEVYRNDQVSVEDIRRMKPRGVLISPGPGCPEESGISLEAVEKLGPDFPLFGVCMGHQCIGQVFGGRIVRAPKGLMHGKTSPVFHNGAGLLEGLSSPFNAARYHSLVIEEETFPNEELELTAWTEDGTCMGVRHKRYPHIQGVQFHPESIITDDGMRIIANFVNSLPGDK